MSDYRPTTTDAITYLRFKLDNAQRDDDLPDVAVSVDADTLALALAEFDAARARAAALEAALRDVCEAAIQTDAYGWHWCCVCESIACRPSKTTRHAPDCPVAAALRLLEPGP